jgi:Polyketide cyclase / dehydrase and lipid transport
MNLTAEPVCECSVDAQVPVAFAWTFMTDVTNWSDPPAEFALEGVFADGTEGVTRMPGHPPMRWKIGGVEPGRAYTIETGAFLDGAVLCCHWRFEALDATTTRLTQRMELRGDQAARYVADIRAAFEPNLEPGMRRLAEMMTRARSEG